MAEEEKLMGRQIKSIQYVRVLWGSWIEDKKFINF